MTKRTKPLDLSIPMTRKESRMFLVAGADPSYRVLCELARRYRAAGMEASLSIKMRQIRQARIN